LKPLPIGHNYTEVLVRMQGFLCKRLKTSFGITSIEKPKYEGAWSSRSLAPLISIVTVSLIPWYYHPKKRIQNAWLRAMIANVYDADRSAGTSLSLSLSSSP